MFKVQEVIRRVCARCQRIVVLAVTLVQDTVGRVVVYKVSHKDPHVTATAAVFGVADGVVVYIGIDIGRRCVPTNIKLSACTSNPCPVCYLSDLKPCRSVRRRWVRLGGIDGKVPKVNARLCLDGLGAADCIDGSLYEYLYIAQISKRSLIINRANDLCSVCTVVLKLKAAGGIRRIKTAYYGVTVTGRVKA